MYFETTKTRHQLLREGSYTLTEDLALKDDMVLEGVGMGTIIKTNGFKIDVTNSDNVQVKNLRIDATGSNAIVVTDESVNTLLDNLLIEHATDFAVTVDDCGGFTARTVHCVDNGSGMKTQNMGNIPSGTELQVTPSLIDNCRFVENDGYGLWTDADHDISITNCNMERNAKNGLHIVRPVQVVVSGCTIERNGTDAESGDYKKADVQVRIEDPDVYSPGFSYHEVTITGCMIAAIATSHAIRYDAEFNDESAINVNGNIIIASNTSSRYGVSFHVNTDQTVLFANNNVRTLQQTDNLVRIVSQTGSNITNRRCLITGNTLDNRSSHVIEQGYIVQSNVTGVCAYGNRIIGDGAVGIQSRDTGSIEAHDNIFDTNLTANTGTTGTATVTEVDSVTI